MYFNGFTHIVLDISSSYPSVSLSLSDCFSNLVNKCTKQKEKNSVNSFRCKSFVSRLQIEERERESATTYNGIIYYKP